MYRHYRTAGSDAQATVTHIASVRPVVKTTKKERLRKGARRQFMEGVSFAGMLELYYESNFLSRRFWTVVMLAAFGSIIYHSCLLLRTYLNDRPSYEFIQTDRRVIPFPKVTVCSPSGVNKTWTSQQLSFPPKEKRLFDALDPTKKERMIDELMALMGHSAHFSIEQSFTQKHPLYFTYHHIVTQTVNDFPHGLSGLQASGMLPSCHDIVFNCQFAGQRLDCCQDAVLQLDEDGPCYDLGVDKEDELSNYSRQSMPGFSPITFTFDLKLDWNYVDSFSTLNGFLIHIGEPWSVMTQPVGVPAGSHATIDVSQPTRVDEKSECFSKPMPDTIFGKYDSKGHLCIMERYVEEVIRVYSGCTFPGGAYTASKDESCQGISAVPTKVSFTGQILTGPEALRLDKIFREKLADMVTSRTRCLPLCRRWEYVARPSYSDLLNENLIAPIGNESTGNITMSRVTVFLAPPYYVSRRELERELSLYKTFMLITDVWALYIGGSVVTLAEIVFYSVNLCVVYARTGLATPVLVPVNTEIRQDLVKQAKLAGKAARYDDMKAAMKKIVKTGANLTKVERNFLSVAYKNAARDRRKSLDVLSLVKEEAAGSEKKQQMAKENREQVRKELEAICYEVVALLDEYLIPKADDPEKKVFYLTMKADYYRYLAEFLSGDRRETAAQNSLQAYQEASTIANNELHPGNPIRLGLAHNFSVFYYKILKSPATASRVAQQAFDEAATNVDTLDCSTLKDSVLVMRKIKYFLTHWLSNKAGDERDA